MDESSTPQRWWRDRGRLLAIAAVLAGLGAVAAGIGYQVLKRPSDVHNGADVAFHAQPPPKPVKKAAKRVDWPTFGFDRARTRFLPAKGVKPPYKKVWRYSEGPLLEFPPAYANGRLYFVNNNGFAYALDAKTGKTIWSRRIAELNASAPTYSHGRLYIVNLEPGQVLKLNAKNGHTVWKRPLPGRAESSPLVVGDTVYFGCETGQLFALNTRTSKTRWTTTLGGAVKASPAYHHGIIFVGDYGGDMSAINAATGKIKWQASSQGPGFAQSGEFYSTPAVAFGRVYAGNNDGRVYSFDEKNGTLAWSHSTGSYVYSGATVAQTQHSPPSVYIGSYDGNIYALDAKTGATRWSHPIGRVIGSLSAVGNIVYVATFDGTTTYGFKMASGKQVFHFPTGAYMPVISDGRWIYLTGYSSITALKPYDPNAKHKSNHGGPKKQKQAAKKQKHSGTGKKPKQPKQHQKHGGGKHS